MKSILAFGNPLLDVTISPKHFRQIEGFLTKYNLKSDGQKEIDRCQMIMLNKDIESLEQHLSPGGCCQNSLRVLQWVSKKQGFTTIFGSVGKDREAIILREKVESEGVTTRYINQEHHPTGKTVALISGSSRSLVAHIGAAELFPLASLLSYPHFPTIFKESDIIFIEAYFLTNRHDTARYIAELCLEQKKLLIFNLCGEYIFDVVPDSIRLLIKNASIIFGNKTEFKALCKLLGFESIEESASFLVKQDKKLVITDGPRPVACYSNGGVLNLTPPRLQETDIKDTTAAGDAFLGGFLSGLAKSQTIEKCVEIGFYAAKSIIKQIGCSLPTYEPEIAF